MNAIAIDDEPQALEVIRLLAEKVPFLSLQASFTDAMEALVYLQSNPVDLVFLDIQMPDITGIEWAKGLANPPLIIFTTAYSEYAAESYELQAVDYLVKPIAFNRFLKAVNRAAQLGQQEKSTFTFLKSGHQYVRIDFDDLRYVQGATNYVEFYTVRERVTVRMKLSEAIELLPDEFAQIHRSYLVNLKHVQRIEHNHVVLEGAKLAIGKSWKDGFMKRLGELGK